ncbi:hypothetical protein QQP08_025662 [Theobroma cacao]|nr:hypothetical protein QQP08_025662 [Theobroma cacao]
MCHALALPYWTVKDVDNNDDNYDKLFMSCREIWSSYPADMVSIVQLVSSFTMEVPGGFPTVYSCKGQHLITNRSSKHYILYIKWPRDVFCTCERDWRNWISSRFQQSSSLSYDQ